MLWLAGDYPVPLVLDALFGTITARYASLIVDRLARVSSEQLVNETTWNSASQRTPINPLFGEMTCE